MDTPADDQPREITKWWVAPLSLGSIMLLFVAAQIVGALLIGQLASIIGVKHDDFNGWIDSSIGVQFLYLVISEGLILLGIYGLLRLLRWSWRTIGLVRPRLKHIAIGAVAVVPYYILYIVVVIVVSQFLPGLDVDQKQEIGFDTATTSGQLILTFISLVLIPPFVEEVAMRGYLYSGLRTWLPKIVAALLVSAVFGAAHLAEGGAAGPLWIGAIDTFVLSLVLVFLREKTGNLWAGITLHGLKNLIAFVLIFGFHVS